MNKNKAETLQIEVGQSYRTRDGRKVDVVKRNTNLWEDSETYPFSAKIGKEKGLYSYTVNGAFTEFEKYDLDLIALWEEPNNAPEKVTAENKQSKVRMLVA